MGNHCSIFCRAKNSAFSARQARCEAIRFLLTSKYLPGPRTNKMSRRKTPGTVPFALDISTGGKIAFHGAPRSVWFQEQNRDV